MEYIVVGILMQMSGGDFDEGGCCVLLYNFDPKHHYISPLDR